MPSKQNGGFTIAQIGGKYRVEAAEALKDRRNDGMKLEQAKGEDKRKKYIIFINIDCNVLKYKKPIQIRTITVHNL